MPQDPAQHPSPVGRGAQYVGAGAVYLALSGVLVLLWLGVGWYVVLVLSMPTWVAGAVLLSVGWPRWQRDRARRRTADDRQPVAPVRAPVRRS